MALCGYWLTGSTQDMCVCAQNVCVCVCVRRRSIGACVHMCISVWWGKANITNVTCHEKQEKRETKTSALAVRVCHSCESGRSVHLTEFQSSPETHQTDWEGYYVSLFPQVFASNNKLHSPPPPQRRNGIRYTCVSTGFSLGARSKDRIVWGRWGRRE